MGLNICTALEGCIRKALVAYMMTDVRSGVLMGYVRLQESWGQGNLLQLTPVCSKVNHLKPTLVWRVPLAALCSKSVSTNLPIQPVKSLNFQTAFPGYPAGCTSPKFALDFRPSSSSTCFPIKSTIDHIVDVNCHPDQPPLSLANPSPLNSKPIPPKCLTTSAKPSPSSSLLVC